jgi:6-phosphogluconolactonase (cycloisomerase 2 family)
MLHNIKHLRVVPAVLLAALLLAVLPGHGRAQQFGNFYETFESGLYRDPVNTTAYWDTLGAKLRLPPFPLTVVGTNDTLASAWDVALDGDYAYVADGDGLVIFDVTNPSTPTFLGSYSTLPNSSAYAVTVAGDYAYIAGSDGRFSAIDVSDPTAPTLTWDDVTIVADGTDVVVAGDYAYVVFSQFLTDFGLVVYDISAPTTPVAVTTYDTTGTSGLDIAGDYLYTVGGGDLIIIDITNPTTPAFVTFLSTPGSASKVVVEGNYAYIADGSGGVQVIDITDPTSPAAVGSMPTAGDANELVIAGDYLYATDGDGLIVADISDPTNPTLVQDLATPGFANGAAVDGEVAYVADLTEGLHAVSVARLLYPPGGVGEYGLNDAVDVAVDGNYAYLADAGVGTLEVLDISDPSNPTSVGSYITGGIPIGVCISGDHAFVADDFTGLKVIDISDPADPALVGSYDTPGWAMGVDVSGDFAYVAARDSGLYVVDISNLAAPTLAGFYFDTPAWTRDVCVSGDLAFVANEEAGLRVIDVSAPAAPTLIGTYDTPWEARDVFVSGDYAFVADGASLEVVDISDPTAPTLARSFGGTNAAGGVYVSGNYAFVADGGYGLRAVNISNPSAPILVGTYDTPAEAYRVCVSGDHAFVADRGSLQVIKVFQREVDVSNNVGRSLTIDDAVGDIASVRISTVQTDSIGWLVSADGGSNWESVTPGAGWHNLTHTGSDLRWRADLEKTQADVNPECDTLDVEWLELLPDGDGDGVPDAEDVCPGVSAAFFDRNGDGCIDNFSGARHVEYWADDSPPLTYYMNENGAPGITDNTDFEVIQNAVHIWTLVPGTEFAASYAGDTTLAEAVVLDGVNLITFSDPTYVFPPGVVSLAVTTSFTEPTVHNEHLYRPGEILEVDVVFNPGLSYRTPTQGSGYDLGAAMAHAAGHMAGISHSAVQTSTMYFVYNDAWSTLEPDDELALIKAYPAPGVSSDSTLLGGTVTQPDGSTPIPGAVVFAIDSVAGDTLSCAVTMPDGSYNFLALPAGAYYISVHPMDGSSAVGYLTPANVNNFVDSTAVTVFVPEYWSLSETNYDDPALKDAVTLSAGSQVGGIDVITNQDITQPTVVSISPADGQTGVLVDEAVVIRFSEPIEPLSVSGNFSVVDTLNSVVANGGATLLSDDSVLVFVPVTSFAAQTVYKVTVDAGITDKFGNPLASPFVSHFTTEFLESDADGDGVPDVTDGCPAVSAAYFDRNGDGCIDNWVGARHTLYWDPNDLPFEYYIHEDGASGVTDGSDLGAVQAGVAEWSALGGVDFSVSYLGTTPQADAQAMDGVNIVTFNDPDNESIFRQDVIAVGITTSATEPIVFDGRLIRPGQIFDADMIYNRNKAFSTPSMGSGADIQSVAVHEAGHLFGFFHSAKLTSTMFYILPPGTDGASLSTEDSTMFFKGYPDPIAAATANVLTGTVTDSVTGEPIPGAIVFAIEAGPGGVPRDTVGCSITLPRETLPMAGMPQEGSFSFAGLPDGDYYIAIYPLNGTSPIRFLEAGNVSYLLDSTAVEDFVPEYWDATESASDDPLARDFITVSGGDSVHVALILNVDTDGPEVVYVSPDDGEGDVRVDAAVFIRFSEPIESSSFTVSTFSLAPSAGGPAIGGLGSFPRIRDDSLLVFKPYKALDFDTEYELTLETGITDKFGNGLETQYVSTFHTEIQPAVSISTLAPAKGIVGSIVTIAGIGFSPVAAEDTVRFSGVDAVVMDATPTQLVVQVPTGIPTGTLVSVTVGPDRSNELTFTVLPPTEVARGVESGVVALGATPRALTVMPDGGRVFVATDAGVSEIVVAPGVDFLDHTPLSIAGGVDELDANPQGSRVYAVGREDSLLHVIDPSTTPTIVLSSYRVGTQPLGILVDRGGDRAYVTTSDSEIQIWDVSRRRLPTEPNAEQIGAIPSPDPNLRGKMALDPVRNRLLALSGAGDLLVFDLDGDSLLAEVAAGTDPRDVAVDPFAQWAYVSDAAGMLVSAARLDPPSKDWDLMVGGSPRGTAITPAGGFLFAANRGLDLLQAVGLLPGSTSYRTVAAAIPHRNLPVDVELSPGGEYAYSIAEGMNQFVVTTVGRGPTLASVSRIAGPTGTELVLSGTGFGTNASDVEVSFAGVTTPPTHLRETSLTVTVPAGAASGTVRVERSTPNGLEVSNELSFEVLGPSSGGLRLASQAQPAGAPELANIMAFSPRGDLLAVAEYVTAGPWYGRLQILDTKPGSATFNQFITPVASAVFDTLVSGVAIAPDGKTAYAVLETRDTIPVVDVDRFSPTFGEQVAVITRGAFPSATLERLVVSPDGQIGFCTGYSDTSYVVDLASGSPTRYEIIDTVATVNGVNDAAFDPSGRTAYLAASSATPIVRIVDLDSTSANFGYLVATIPIPGSPLDVPRALAFTPDGDRCLVLTREPTSPWNRSVVTFDTSDPLNPVYVDQRAFGGTSAPVYEVIDVSPRGDRAIFQVDNMGYNHIDLTTTPYPLVEAAYPSLLLSSMDADYTPDASRYYVVSTLLDSVFVYDFNEVQTLAVASGDLQTGVIDQPLPLPLQVEVQDAVSNPVQGIPVTFEVTGGGGVMTATNTVRQTVSTDANGVAGATLRLGSSTAASANTVEARAIGLLGSPVTFSATGVLDPDTQPLRFLTVTPQDGTQNVRVTTAAQMTFSRAVDSTSVTSSTFFLHKTGQPTLPVPSIIGFTDGKRKLSLSPIDPLEPGMTYFVKATTGLLDQSHGALEVAVSTSFETEPPPPLLLSSVNPPAATVGTIVVIAGTGFDPVPANNTALFEDVAAAPYDGSVDYLKVVVPVDATTDSLRVSTTAGTSNALPFDVLIPTKSSVDEVIDGVATTSGTKGIAINPTGTLAYAISSDPPEVIPIDIENESAGQGIPVGDNPVAIDIHPNGKRAYVVNFGSNSVTVINIDPTDTQDFNSVEKTVVVGANPIDLIASPLGDRVFIANLGSSDVSVLDVGEGSETYNYVIDSPKVGGGSRAVTINPTGTRLYVGTDNGYLVFAPYDQNGFVYVIAKVDNKQATKTMAINPTGTRLTVLTTEGDVFVYNVEPGSKGENDVVTSVQGRHASTISINPTGTLLYVTLDTDVVLVYSIDTPDNVSVMEDAAGFSELTLVNEFPLGSELGPIVFDPTGSGLALVSSAGDKEVLILNTSNVSVGPLAAAVQVTPRTLNIKSRGRWVTGQIELMPSPPFEVQDIDIGTVLLNGAVPAEPDSWEIRDTDQDGIDELVVKFCRAQLQSVLPQGDSVEVEITGQAATRSFAGLDTIRTIRPKVTFPTGGEVLSAGSVVNVTWTSPAGYDVDAIDVYWSSNDGNDWLPIAEGIPDLGTVPWATPWGFQDSCRVMVTLYAGGTDLGMGMSDEMFMLDAPVAIMLESFKGMVKDGTPVVTWTTGLELNTEGFHIYRSEDENGSFERLTSEAVPSKGGARGANYEFKDETARPNQSYFYKLRQVSVSGAGDEFGPFDVVFRASFELDQNFPNPFNPNTTIRYTIAQDAHVTLTVYDVAGRRVRTLVDDNKRPNFYKIVWDGKNDNGEQVASGVYFYRLVAGQFTKSRKMVVLK